MPILLGILLAGVIISLSAFWSGYVISILWNWFLSPLGIKTITTWHAIGLSTLLSVFLGSRGIKDNKGLPPGEVILETISWAIAIPAFALLIGWIAHINL